MAHRTGSDDLDGKHVAVQGLGHVGYWLCKYLDDEGARWVLPGHGQPWDGGVTAAVSQARATGIEGLATP